MPAGGEGISEGKCFGGCPIPPVNLHSRSTGTCTFQTIPIPDARHPSSSLLRKDYFTPWDVPQRILGSQAPSLKLGRACHPSLNDQSLGAAGSPLNSRWRRARGGSADALPLGTQELSDSLSLHPSPLSRGTEASSESPPPGEQSREGGQSGPPRGLWPILSILALLCLPISLGSCGPTH